jgi:hypothetical protein
MSTVSEIQKNDDNKVNFKITGSKETVIKINIEKHIDGHLPYI